MSLYDMFGKNFIQLKARPNPNMCHYRVRAKVPYNDGIYLAPDGIVVIKNGVFKCSLQLNQIYDKWGEPFDLSRTLEKRNPLYAATRELVKKYKQKKKSRRKKKR